MKATLDHFGRVDGCFANAGIGGGGRRAFIDRTEEEWRTMFATNLDGVFHVFQAAARHMTERSEAGDAFGRLVATSSLASLFGTARNEHYAATKAAINALCRALAVELARHGVTANAILPGWIRSDMTAGIMANEKFVANVMPRIPVRRFGEPSRFRRHRGLSHEQGVVVSHRRLLRDRRRLYRVLRAFRGIGGLQRSALLSLLPRAKRVVGSRRAKLALGWREAPGGGVSARKIFR